MDFEETLKLIGNISPHAADYVVKAFAHKKLEIICSIATELNKGVFLKVDDRDCCIFYASFHNEDNIEQMIETIRNKTKETVSKTNSKEICFNVYGKNSKIIGLARELGFKLDMEGYHLEYMGEEPPEIKDGRLIMQGFEHDMLNEFVDLFDSSYEQLNRDNGWKLNSHAENKTQFCQKLNALNGLNQVRSFWLNNDLVGAYIFEQNYITDIVVKPMFQNKGYGSYLLFHCIRDMSLNRAIKNIRLRVAKTNIGARKLYERNNFIEIACFAEHTY